MIEHSKAKLLFVTANFWQAGAQRYVYELDKAIDRNKFEVHILSIQPLNASKEWSDYYYERHLELGSQIYFLQKTLVRRLKASLSYRLGLDNLKLDKRLSKFLNQFDVIAWIGEYNFNLVAQQIADKIIAKSFIHMMTSKSQTDTTNNYEAYDKEKFYHFVSSVETEAMMRYEFSDFHEYEHTYFPLCFEIKTEKSEWQFKPNKVVKKIGIFTRLDLWKPLDPFFYAFHLLLDALPNLELHIFGTGDPDKAGATRYTKNLHIHDKVKFRGHSLNINLTAIEEDLDLIWFQGFNGVPGGYAGYDLCLTGIPQIYWELLSDVKDRKAKEGYPCFSKLRDFVASSEKLLTNSEVAESQSKKQFEITKKEQDIRKWMHKLEESFLSVTKLKVRNI